MNSATPREMTVLHGHDFPDTAHLTFCYPFGRTVKCVRREWVETSAKGAARGQQRFVTQTTHPTFNAQYTHRIDADGQGAADAWATEQIHAGAARWNQPKAGIYNLLVVMIERPLEDGSGRVGVDHISLSPYSGADRVKSFKDQVGEQLDERQRQVFSPIERVVAAHAAR